MIANTQPLKLSQVVHESEAQRQHSRLPLPVRVIINRQKYAAKNISAGGVAIKNIEGPYKKGSVIHMSLVLPCEAFSLTLQMDAKVEYYNAQDKSLGCSFLNMKSEEISLLNHVLKASMAGEATTYSDVINVVSRNNFVTKRKEELPQEEQTQVNIKGQLLRMISIAVIGLILMAFIGANLYERLFIVKTANAVVRGASVDVRTVNDGVFESALEQDTLGVKPEQLIGVLRPFSPAHSRQQESIKSPCDCYISKLYDYDGEYVPAGTRIATLVPLDSMPWVIVSMKPSEAARLKMHQRANIAVMGSAMSYTGRIVDIESGLGDETVPPEYRFLEQPVIVRVRPDQKIPLDAMNRPAKVSFYTR